MIQDKQDQIINDLSDIKVDIAEIKVDVAHHIKRCDLLEQSVDILKSETSMARGALYAIGLLGTLATIADVYFKIFRR